MGGRHRWRRARREELSRQRQQLVDQPRRARMEHRLMSPAEIITAASGSTVVGSVITWLLTRGIVKRKQDHAERADARADWARFTGEMRQALEAERRSALAQATESQERHAAS